MIIKKIFLIIIFFTVTNCGYKAIFSNQNNLDFSIKKIELEGNKKISRKIIILTGLKKNNNKGYSYNLILDSNKKIDIVSKDKSKNASVYKTTIDVEFTLKDPNNQDAIFKTKKFTSSFLYNDIDNKFDLLQYQKNIELNLIDKISQEIIIFLNS
jgi:outer membrane lipopolysaccharide assembly protein LptE/RlpB